MRPIRRSLRRRLRCWRAVWPSRSNDKCLDRIPELQAPCLMQGADSLILNDGHSTSIVEALTSGPASDLAMEASFTPQLSYGYYSPYIASVLDIARILASFHTAQYQYIPALASLQGEQLALTLNTPPSFHNPKSVMVAALPAVEQAQLPPLHAVDPKESTAPERPPWCCRWKARRWCSPPRYAHDVTLSLAGQDGKAIDLPAQADAQQGGFVVDTSALGAASLGDSVRGSLHGYWGFEAYEGPSFQLVNAHAQTWQLAGGDEGSADRRPPGHHSPAGRQCQLCRRCHAEGSGGQRVEGRMEDGESR